MGRYDYARSHSGASRDSRDAAGRKRKLSESSGGNSSKVNKTEKTRVGAYIRTMFLKEVESETFVMGVRDPASDMIYGYLWLLCAFVSSP